jgi:hypothetical protein
VSVFGHLGEPRERPALKLLFFFLPSFARRKRVSIAEVALSGSPLTLWDNSTRGLDSANAIEFCKTLRMATELGGSVAGVAIYQAPQSAYDVGLLVSRFGQAATGCFVGY